MDLHPGRGVTFRNPEVEMSPKGDVEDYSMDPSVLDVETWLEWQAQQLGTTTWWMELKAILGIRDSQKLAQKIKASVYIPKVRMRALLEPEYTVPPPLRVLTETPSFQMSYLIKMCSNNWLSCPLFTPGACNTGEKNSVHQEAQTSIL